MALEAYINGKSAEELVKNSLQSIGCYVDDIHKFNSDWDSLYSSGNKNKNLVLDLQNGNILIENSTFVENYNKIFS